MTLSISGRVLDTEECTDYITLAPVKVWRQTHAHLLHCEDLDLCAVSFGVIEYPSDDMNTVVRQVLSQIWPVRRRIVEYVGMHGLNAAFIATVAIYDERPRYRLGPESLRGLCFFGYEFSWEVFDYS